MSVIPESHLDLLTRPLYAHLATLMPDGTPQVTPVWTVWDGEFLRFTTTTDRQKGRNASARPYVAISINDPDRPYRYLEVRGTVERVEPDPQGDGFDLLARRYGLEYDRPVGDAERRVVIVVRPTRCTSQ
ncbi:PPOX class F420-dependent oxidoreductase [Nonomuraea spiralis]|uniref:PPOX class F420-dependent oxidoreductase n=1 Tax=Nonomuraea spiralis TaxID=46182 RepID=A0ABV5IKQ8_9ACTN|nr:MULTISPECIES: PPOX class F420-dependent oxidoreductase [Nonomuraea]RSN01008.1 PPOX class F420-dependent oxidoreductase [Nonomuraea sp. WAC 01424]GGT37083.1 PPOX class F420-dependent enzyme [Nonomuraea spiralis]